MSWLLSLAALALVQDQPARVTPPDPVVQEAASVPPASAEPDDPEAVVDDVIVWGSVEAQVRDFVEEVEAAPYSRGIGRWDQALCIGVVNFKADVGDALLEYLTAVATDLGVGVGAEGCEPTAVIVGVAGADALATALVDERRNAFRLNASQTGRGSAALQVFAESDAPVRWWHVSFTFDANTGRFLTRIPGAPPFRRPPPGGGFLSKKRAATTDRIRRAVVIVDVDRIGDVTFEQLAGYLSFVTFTQVDPSSSFASHDTILNLFDGRREVDRLTEWDMTYLRELYSAPARRRTHDRQVADMAVSIAASQPADAD